MFTKKLVQNMHRNAHSQDLETTEMTINRKIHKQTDYGRVVLWNTIQQQKGTNYLYRKQHG